MARIGTAPWAPHPAATPLMREGRSLRRILLRRRRSSASDESDTALLKIFGDQAASRSATRCLVRYSQEPATRDRQTQVGVLANMSHELRTPLNAIIGFPSHDERMFGM